MEQIYYTQCPIGYGLGASNGYQIKRITAGYPLTGDFRHLGLKAFPGGGRILAPPVLRYRREDDCADLARLTPRSQEYQTERGLWGRPGGVFAHGFRLSMDELGSLGRWPAGLFDNPGWQVADPEPTRGRPPEDVDLAALGSFRPAEFAAVAPLFAGEDPDWLARVWTALAQVTREGRTLFLIDEPDRLARSVAILTFGFPAVLRGDLTFSTYHDRPEELPGYRLQGTAPVVRPNRLALLSLGVVADRSFGTIEPAVEPAAWATTLAGWFTRREAVDEADWMATEARARGARRPDDPPDLIWSDAWLDPLIAWPEAYRDRSGPKSVDGWTRLRQLARWSGRAGIGDEWLRHRGPTWWLEQAAGVDPGHLPEARAALVAHGRLRDAWKSHEHARGWGDAVATWYGSAPEPETDEAVTALFGVAPRAARPSFAQALLRGLSPDRGAQVLALLRGHQGSDRATLLPLEAGVLAATLIQEDRAAEANDPLRREVGEATARLHRIVGDAAQFPGALAAALDAVAGVAQDHPDAVSLLAEAVAGALDLGGGGERSEGLAWALRQGAPASWLAPALRPRLADLGRGDLFDSLRARVPADLWPRLARAVVAVAQDPGLPDDAFRLAIERLVLPLAPRPHDPTWAESYLRRTPSTWDLFRRLYSRELATIGLPAWVDQCRGRGEVSPAQAARVDSIRQFARSLSSGNPQSLVENPIPTGSAGDRAPFLHQMLGRLGGSQLEGLPLVLDACRAAWPGAFDPGAPGLPGLARPLAERLAPGHRRARDWMEAIIGVLDRLGLLAGGGGFEPDGLLAEVVAALPAGTDINPWPLRQFLFEDDRAWPTLAASIRADLKQLPPGDAPLLVERWDSKVIKSAQPKVLPARFWELVLNALDPPRLATVVPARARDLQSLGSLRSWDRATRPEAAADLRDAYARSVPLDPLPTGRLAEVERWLESRGHRPSNPDDPIPLDEPTEAAPRLSSFGRDRWRCLKALTEYGPAASKPSSTREAAFQAWQAHLPTGCLTADEVYRWMGWTILGVDPTDPPFTDPLATWLFTVGVTDAKRVGRWIEEVPIDVEAPAQLDRARFVGDLERAIRRCAGEARDARRRAGP